MVETSEWRSPRLLVSVRNVREARAALEGGADWVDLKEPRRGPLGAVDAPVARGVAAAVAGAAPLSAATGELLDAPQLGRCALLHVDGLQLLKTGLAECRLVAWQERWLAVRDEAAAAGKQLALTAYVDAELAHAPAVAAVVRFAAEQRCPWLLLDTFAKSQGRLLAYFDAAELQKIGRTMHESGGRLAVAGRLDLNEIRRLPADAMDLVAVRSAACRGGRDGMVDANLVRRIRACMRETSGQDPAKNARMPSGG